MLGGRVMIAMFVRGYFFAIFSTASVSRIICAVSTPLQPKVIMQLTPCIASAHASYPFTFSSKVNRSTASFD